VFVFGLHVHHRRLLENTRFSAITAGQRKKRAACLLSITMSMPLF
jgi:hypothetical protein